MLHIYYAVKHDFCSLIQNTDDLSDNEVTAVAISVSLVGIITSKEVN